MSELDEILYQIRTYDSDIEDIPDEWRMSLDNGKHYGRAKQIYDFVKHRYIVEYVSDNYDIHTEIQTLLQENKHLNLQLDQALKDYEELLNKIDKAREYMEEAINSDSFCELPSGKITDIGYCIVAFEDLLKILGDKK